MAFCSDGSSANGIWHEALNLAAIWDLPVIFVLENNQYAVSTPIRDSARVDHLSERAAAYGMPGLTVDGNDAVAVYEAMPEPLRRARAGEGPTLIECMTYRHGGHHVNDPGLYLPQGGAGALEGPRPAARPPRAPRRAPASTRPRSPRSTSGSRR